MRSPPNACINTSPMFIPAGPQDTTDDPLVQGQKQGRERTMTPCHMVVVLGTQITEVFTGENTGISFSLPEHHRNIVIRNKSLPLAPFSYSPYNLILQSPEALHSPSVPF